MKLKFIVTNESDLPEDETLKGLYTKTGDKWILDIEGAVPKAQLDQFRETNVDLKKKLEQYGDITPERAAELKEKEETFKGGNAKTAEQIKEEVERRVAELKTTHQTALTAAETKAAKLQRDLEAHVIDRALIEAGTELGLRPTAHEDITFRGRKTFKLDEHGKPVAVDAEGNTIYSATGDPMTPKDFVGNLTKAAPHLFEPSSGSGSGGSGSGRGGSPAVNPFKTETFNLTAQSQMLKENPAQAKQMAAAAGVTI